ncbi:amidohydrolase family protein [Achromobacter sp. GG226]|uniref:amidohydrolase family protein n=1 Tax=Verticiella alkaliphila TaxID=2779529 RepID=UPI001C0CB563|nr:amidohydrolase family protein [Verticiella sp. GG226]MBU4609275.1 amidohydrolase family protein [Verticiella sp. GG226]
MSALAFTLGTQPPAVALPALACDCHVHVYDDQYPAAPNARLRPPNATPVQYRALQARLGLTRVVLVNPSTYGTDNRALCAGLAAFGSASRGVAVIEGRESDATLRSLHAQGVRGVRLNLSLGVTGSLDDLEALAHRIAGLGWHLQLLMPPQQLADAAPRLAQLPVPLVFDHFARLPSATALTESAHAHVLRLQAAGKAWVKLSGGYIVSPEHRVSDPTLTPLARSFIDNAPERVIWGSDWPHATSSAGTHPWPDDAEQLDCLAHWAQTPARLQQILVDNPSTLYDFPADPKLAAAPMMETP